MLIQTRREQMWGINFAYEFGGGNRDRTYVRGFGDRCSTTKLYPQQSMSVIVPGVE